MYQTDFYRCTDHEKLGFFLKHYPFAVLEHDGEASGNFAYLPLLIEEWTPSRRALFSHIDNENRFLKHLRNGTGAVHAIFQGPNEYISPLDYVSEQLPTWNYSVAHASGVMRLVTDYAEKMSLMEKMVDALEPQNGFRLDRGDKNVNHLMTRITFFVVEVTDIEAVFKYSQEKHREDTLAAKSSLLRKLEEKNRYALPRVIESIRTDFD